MGISTRSTRRRRTSGAFLVTLALTLLATPVAAQQTYPPQESEDTTTVEPQAPVTPRAPTRRTPVPTAPSETDAAQTEAPAPSPAPTPAPSPTPQPTAPPEPPAVPPVVDASPTASEESGLNSWWLLLPTALILWFLARRRRSADAPSAGTGA
jgi:hypothetical protein